MLSILLGKPDQSSHEIVKDYWKTQLTVGDFETTWKTSLHDGWIAGRAVNTIGAAGNVTSANGRRSGP